jgi:sulfopropanediol 3-dehydrogenase
VPQALKDDIDWAHDNISRFAEAQRATAQDMQIELRPGLIAGQRQIPLGAAGCYVPGGRYSHIACNSCRTGPPWGLWSWGRSLRF